MKNLRTIILAAGRGTRMKSETPKVLHKICGQPMIQYVLDIASFVGSLKTCVVLGHKHKVVQDFLDKECQTVVQEKLLGTADAVKTASSLFKSYRGDVLILCADTPLLNKNTIKQLVKKHRKTKAACTLLTAVVHEPEGYGRIIRGDKDAVIAIREEKDASEFEKNIREINVGVYCCRAKDLTSALKAVKLNKRKKEFYLTDVVEFFVEQDLSIETLEADAQDGLGVNDREGLAIAENIIKQRILKEHMQAGVTIVDPVTTYIGTNVKIGTDTIIQPLSVIEENVRIGKKCSIGPFARIRPGTKIDDEVEIGNFAEVSRTQIGKKTLVKHFSFLGDAKVGSKANIGAGVVTANFDGVDKNVTRISDSAFIGSDSILVAPVQIGKGAVTGAGCVVTKGKIVPDNGTIIGIPGKISKGRKHS